MTAKPHDALFKAAFEDPEHAGAFMRSVLPAPICAAIDWGTLTREAGSFIDPKLDDRHSDLLFSARIGERPALIYVLLEHQSTTEHYMLLRMLQYLVLIWLRHVQEQGGPLPLVIPLLVSQVPGGWSAPVSFHELFEPLPDSVPELEDLIPSFSMFIEDLDHLDNEELESRALAVFPKLALWFLRDARDTSRLLANLDHWADFFAAALEARNGMEAVIQLLHYVAAVGGRVKFEHFCGRLSKRVPQVEQIAMSYVEQLRREGRQQGRQEGQLVMLHKLLTLEFGELSPGQLARLRAATDSELERYLERALRAESLAAVFEV